MWTEHNHNSSRMTAKLDLRWLEPVSVLLTLSFVQIWDFSSELHAYVYVLHENSTSLFHMYGWCGCQLAFKKLMLIGSKNWRLMHEDWAWTVSGPPCFNTKMSVTFKY